MNPAHLPTEAQCLAMSACTIAKDLLDTIAQLPFLASEQAGQAAPLADLAHAHARLLRLARTLQFDAERQAILIDDQVEADRELHALTVKLVDACRMARGVALEGSICSAAQLQGALADVAEDALADMQGLLTERFPGEADI